VDVVMQKFLLCLWGVWLVLMSTPAAADRPVYCGTERWQPFIAEAAVRFEIPQAWLHEVIRAESAGCESMQGRPITSTAGAMGLMQLMPATWAEFRRRLSLGDDPYGPRDNILAGAAYLRELYDRYGSPGFLAAYHAGSERYEAYRLELRPLPHATLGYLQRIRPELNLSAKSPAVFVHAKSHPIGDLFVPLQHADQRDNHTPIELPVDPPDVQSERAR
jgi:soluble lytic murein transglycosylase-like protein